MFLEDSQEWSHGMVIPLSFFQHLYCEDVTCQKVNPNKNLVELRGTFGSFLLPFET